MTAQVARQRWGQALRLSADDRGDRPYRSAGQGCPTLPGKTALRPGGHGLSPQITHASFAEAERPTIADPPVSAILIRGDDEFPKPPAP